MKKKLSQRYEELAKELGYKDWNTVCGLLSPHVLENVKQTVRSVWQEELNSAKQLDASAKNNNSDRNITIAKGDKNVRQKK